MTTGQPPNCFGKSWSASAVECKGGADPTYSNPKNDSHVRDKCVWYSQCAARTCASKSPPAPQAMQPRSLPMAPYSQQVRPNPSQMAPQQQQQQYLARHQHHPMVHPEYYHPGMASPEDVYNGPHQVPMPYQAPGAQMPSYLAVPEPMTGNVPWYKRLGREIFRSMVKSSGHTVASFVDHNPIQPPRRRKHHNPDEE